MHENQNIWKASTLLAGLTLLVLFVGLGFRELESGDETRVAGIAAETFLEGNYLVPRLNGSPFLEYPPLYYWAAAGAYSLFGINDFAAKLPSVLAAFGMVMLTFVFARKLKFSEREAFLSGIILLFSAQFFSESRTCRVDMMLAFFIELSLFAFYAMTESEIFRKRAGYWGLFVLGLTGGIYTKGLIGIVLPAAVIGSWLIGSDVPARRIARKRYCAAFGGGILALGLAGIWYVLLWHSEGEAMFNAAFWTNNLGRFSGSQSDHAESIFYYFIKLPTLFLPWLPVLPFAFFAAFRKIRKERNKALFYLTLGVLVPFAVLCMASGKRVVYLLPLYAPCALLCGWYLGNLPDRVRNFSYGFLQKFSDHPIRLGIAVLVTVILMTISIDVGIAIHMNQKKSLRPLFERCAELEKNGHPLFLVDASERTRGAAYFYLRHSLPERQSIGTERKTNERWIVREKEKIANRKSYADHHAIIGD